MKQLILAIVFGWAMSDFALANCTEDCEGPFQTCLKLCDQTSQDSMVGPCRGRCDHGHDGCLNRCNPNADREAEKKKIDDRVNSSPRYKVPLIDNRGSYGVAK